MTKLRILYHLARADFLERSRSYNFLIILCLALSLGYAVNMGQIVIRFNICKEIFDSAWVGVMMAIAISFFLGFFGFYLVKGSIDRDERTGIGQIMAATPMRRMDYTFGKWFSHLMVLSLLLAILALETLVIQIFRLGVANLNPGILLAPFFWLTLPFVALVAALAVLFETIPFIKGGLSNVIYFFLFVFLLMGIISPAMGQRKLFADPSGIAFLLQEVKSAGLDCGGKSSLNDLAVIPPQESVGAGIEWDTNFSLSRIGLLALAVVLTGISAIFFTRFDPSKGKLRSLRVSKRQENSDKSEEVVPKKTEKTTRLTPLAAEQAYHQNISRIILAEIRLMLKGNHWIWYLGAASLWIGSAVASKSSITFWMIALALWPLLIWSKMGTREAYFRTDQIVFSSARPLLRLLLSSWLAGVVVTAIIWSGAAINFVLHNQMTNLWACGLAILLVPSLALMLGVWTGTSKVFEVIYLMLWYAGIANRLPAIDFMGLTSNAVVFQHPLWMLVIFAACILLALIGRRQRMFS